MRAFIYALPKDPHWMYAWWDLSTGIPDGTDASSVVLLRVHDVTDIIFNGRNSHSSFDINTGTKIRGDWYVQVPYAGRVYVIEAGMANNAGLRPVCRSNAAFFPPDGPCRDVSKHWTTLSL